MYKYRLWDDDIDIDINVCMLIINTPNGRKKIENNPSFHISKYIYSTNIINTSRIMYNTIVVS